MVGRWFSCAVLEVAMLATASLQAQILKLLYNFNGAPNGALPIGGVVRIEGSFYGTTADGGGDSTGGTVFKVDLEGNATTLHSFSGSPDGYGPLAGLIKDGDGNLYGTTYNGGVYNIGTIFEVSSTGVETVLYSFSGYPADGANPGAGLVRDAVEIFTAPRNMAAPDRANSTGISKAVELCSCSIAVTSKPCFMVLVPKQRMAKCR
jgi:uncharacterized repeat protein (TIGR03803 family)